LNSYKISSPALGWQKLLSSHTVDAEATEEKEISVFPLLLSGKALSA